MKSKATKKRTSKYDHNRRNYLSDDGTVYYYEHRNPDTGRYERIPLTVGKDGVTEEIILFLDSLDHEEELGNRYEYEHKDPLFEWKRVSYEAKHDTTVYDPWESVIDPDDEIENILFAEKMENPDVATVREVIETRCNERQQNLFFAHFGERKQLEEIRREEVAASGREKSLQSVLNVKNDVIRKAADAFGVQPVKRRRAKKG